MAGEFTFLLCIWTNIIPFLLSLGGSSWRFGLFFDYILLNLGYQSRSLKRSWRAVSHLLVIERMGGGVYLGL
jgi:hypothetical protein